MTSAAETVHTRVDGRVARVVLDRPPLNILDVAMMKALGGELERLLAPPAKCDVIVFQGAGPKAFSAGAEVRDHTPDRVADMLAVFHGIFRLLDRSDCMTIAAVHGHCLGGGMELALFCDFVVATESAKFGQPEIKLGCFPPIALVALPGLVGQRAATDLILTGRTMGAVEARAMGLVTRVVPDDGLDAAIAALLGELAALSPAVVRMGRRYLRRATGGADFETRLAEVERLYLEELMGTEDAREGIQAFLEKRAPVWRGK